MRGELNVLIKFLATGATCALVHFAVFYLLLWFGASPELSAVSAFLTATTLSLRINYSFTFKSSANIKRAAFRFFAISALGAALTFVLMRALTFAGASNTPSMLISAGIVMGMNFIAYRRWVFN